MNDRVLYDSDARGEINHDHDPALVFVEKKDDKALRYNDGKLQWSLVHFQSLEPMVRVLEYGTEKYSRENWKKGLDKNEILESMMRHLTALLDGEVIDAESKQYHVGHIMCNAMFYHYFYVQQMNRALSEKIRTCRD